MKPRPGPIPAIRPSSTRWPRFETRLQPFALLTLLHEVETAFGRKRSVPNAPRTLDLDLLDYQGRVEEGAVRAAPSPHGRAALCAGTLGRIAPGLAPSGFGPDGGNLAGGAGLGFVQSWRNCPCGNRAFSVMRARNLRLWHCNSSLQDCRVTSDPKGFPWRA